MAGKVIAAKIALEGSEEVKKQLQSLGDEGEKAVKKLSDSAKAAANPLKGIGDTASNAGRTAAEGLGQAAKAGQDLGTALQQGASTAAGALAQAGGAAGQLGTVLTTVAQAGGGFGSALALSAGGVIGALALVGGAVLAVKNKFAELGAAAAESINKIQSSAKSLGIDNSSFLSIQRGLQAVGVDADDTLKGLQRLNEELNKPVQPRTIIDKSTGKEISDVEAGIKRAQGVLSELNGTLVQVQNGVTIVKTGLALGPEVLTPFQEAIKKLGLNLEEMQGKAGTAKGQLENLLGILERVSSAPPSAQGGLLKSLGLEGFAGALSQSIDKIKTEIARLDGVFGGVSDQVDEAARRHKEAVDRLKVANQEVERLKGSFTIDIDTSRLENAAKVAEKFGSALKNLAEGNYGQAIADSLDSLGQFALPESVLEGIKKFGAAAAEGIKNVRSKIQALLADLKGNDTTLGDQTGKQIAASLQEAQAAATKLKTEQENVTSAVKDTSTSYDVMGNLAGPTADKIVEPLKAITQEEPPAKRAIEELQETFGTLGKVKLPDISKDLADTTKNAKSASDELAGVGAAISTAFEKVKAALGVVWRELGIGSAKAATDVQENLGQITQTDPFAGLVSQAQAAFDAIKQGAAEVAQSIQQIGSGGAGAVDAGGGLFQPIIDGIDRVKQALVDLSSAIGSVDFSPIATNAQQAFQQIQTSAQQIFQTLSASAQQAFQGLALSVQTAFDSLVVGIQTRIAAINAALAGLVLPPELAAAAQQISEAIAQAFEQIPQRVEQAFSGLAGAVEGAMQGVSSAVQSMVQSVNSMLDELLSKIQAVAAAAAAAGAAGGQGGKDTRGTEAGPGGADSNGLPGFAIGGHIRGPGTGTSDSILARLSHGEFVIRAAAVQKFGPAFFDMLNRLKMPKFAMGGLVNAMAMPMPALNVQLPAFAAGGPVNTRGAMVSFPLEIGGQQYDLQGHPDTVAALQRHSTLRQISATNKRAPGWNR